MTSPPPSTDGRPGLAATIALYTLARLGLLAVIAVLLLLAGVPLVIALLVALIVALPLSMVLFRGLRGRLDAALAAAGERRAREREALRAKLRGDDPVARPRPSDEAADREADAGQG